MCGDPDSIAYGVYENSAWDLYFGNPLLADRALKRNEDIPGWTFRASFAQGPHATVHACTVSTHSLP
jgi:hypothetical protein